MRAGIMQPYFFPYAGYFALVAASDTWVVFDTVQYTPKTWMNRNRVLSPRSGWCWVTVPVRRSSRSVRVHEVELADPDRAEQSVLGALSHYRHHAPQWRAVEDLVRRTFGSLRRPSLTDLDVAGLVAVCEHLGLACSPLVCSELDLALEPVDHPGGWAPAIASALGADAYVNPVGGAHLFRTAEFTARGVTLQFLEPPELTYATGPFTFEPNLSILDVLMWNDPAEVARALTSATVVTAPSEPSVRPGGQGAPVGDPAATTSVDRPLAAHARPRGA
ncbi:MAG: WbqC family protein [Acidimicrobiales bacterium]